MTTPRYSMRRRAKRPEYVASIMIRLEFLLTCENQLKVATYNEVEWSLFHKFMLEDKYQKTKNTMKRKHFHPIAIIRVTELCGLVCYQCNSTYSYHPICCLPQVNMTATRRLLTQLPTWRD